MRKSIPTIAALLVLMSSTAFAESGMKSWYMNIGLGYANPSYASNPLMSAYSDVQKSTAGTTNMGLSVDLSVYWPASKHLLLGIADTGFSDVYSNPANSGSNTAIIGSNLLFSIQYYPFSEDASWLFFRLDPGLGLVGTSSGFSFAPSNASTGFAFHGAVGLAIPAGSVRLPLIAGYYYENVGTGAVNAAQVALSVMW